MKKLLTTVVVTGLILGVTATASQADTNPAPWLAPLTLVSALPPELASMMTPANITFKRWDGPILSGQVAMFASNKKMREAVLAGEVLPGSVVIYDPEKWKSTPQIEQDDPITYMKGFVRFARAHGMIAGLAPSTHNAKRELQIEASKLDADIFQAQLQMIIDPARYRAAAKELLANMAPGEVFIAELSVNRASAEELYAQWKAVKHLVDGFALWSTMNPENLDPDQLEAAVTFLTNVVATETA